MSIKKSEVNNDIYDSNLFDLESIHTLEFIESNKPFRWSDGYFKIKPKKELNNLCLNFIYHSNIVCQNS